MSTLFYVKISINIFDEGLLIQHLHGIVCTGAVIVGEIEIANGVTIAANAVVSKSMNQEGCVVGGVPAKMIKDHAGFSMRDYWKKIKERVN